MQDRYCHSKVFSQTYKNSYINLEVKFQKIFKPITKTTHFPAWAKKFEQYYMSMINDRSKINSKEKTWK